MKNVNECVRHKLDECKEMLNEVASYLDDAKTSSFVKSKRLLMNEASSKTVEAMKLIDEILPVIRKYLVPSADALKIEVDKTLKEVGLTDMDDPSYAENIDFDGYHKNKHAILDKPAVSQPVAEIKSKKRKLNKNKGV